MGLTARVQFISAYLQQKLIDPSSQPRQDATDTSNSSRIYTRQTARCTFPGPLPSPTKRTEPHLSFCSPHLPSLRGTKEEEGCAFKQQQHKQLRSLGREEQAEITSGWEEGVGRPFLFGWIHSGFHFWPVCWGTSWSLVHMALEVANQKPDGSRICFPTHLHKMSLGSHSELTLPVGVGAVPQHQACQEEEEASGRFWDCPLHSWMATEGWQAGPEGRFRFCLLEVAAGGVLEQKTRHLLMALYPHCMASSYL